MTAWSRIQKGRGVTSTFWGEYEHQLDDKGRVTVPADWRPGLAEGFFLCPGLDGTCLYLLPKWRWAIIEEALLKVTYDDEAGTGLQRLFGSGVETKLDGQGRVFIPPKLRGRGAISDRAEVLLFGAGDRIEIWDPKERQLFEDKEFNREALREKIRRKAL